MCCRRYFGLIAQWAILDKSIEWKDLNTNCFKTSGLIDCIFIKIYSLLKRDENIIVYGTINKNCGILAFQCICMNMKEHLLSTRHSWWINEWNISIYQGFLACLGVWSVRSWNHRYPSIDWADHHWARTKSEMTSRFAEMFYRLLIKKNGKNNLQIYLGLQWSLMTVWRLGVPLGCHFG